LGTIRKKLEMLEEKTTGEKKNIGNNSGRGRTRIRN